MRTAAGPRTSGPTSSPSPATTAREPACVRVCPTGAHARHEELGGLVLIDRDVCIGCVPAPSPVPTRRRSSIARRAR
ncbi:MAG: hypothetical protein ACLUNV_04090 [Sutterella wadsworthensis]